MKKILLLIFLTSFSLKIYSQDFELKKIRFVGNSKFSDGTLSGIILSKETPFWFWKFLNKISNLGKEPVYFDSLNIDEDIKRIEKFYRDNGFFFVNVKSDYKLNEANKSAELTFLIDEGERFKINSYKYIGIDSTRIGQWLYLKIMKEKKIQENSFFQRDRIEDDANRIVNELRNFGFMLADRERITATIDTLNKIVDVTLSFNPRRYFTVSEIRIEKSGISKDAVEDDLIYKLVGIQPNEKYSHQKNLEGQLRLYRTGLFTSALV